MATTRRRASPAIGLRLLGPLEAEVDGHVIDVGGPKPRALLAILALDVGRVVSVDRLVEDLWAGTSPDTAPHAVQVYVSQLRRALGDTIARRGPGYILGIEPEAVDAHRFTRLIQEGHEHLRAGNHVAAADTLRDALALWRGPALADFAYEPFAQAEIARLDEQRFGALEDRVEADLALGRHGELITEIEALVEAQPLRERPRALLMRALYLAGRQADALAAYRATRERLVDELGIEPSPELRELESAILRQDPSLAPPRAAPATLRTRRVAAVLSVAPAELDAVDVEVEDRKLEELATITAATAARHGGMTQRLADGSVVAVFGVPVAHEDDPLRAARTAIDVRDALAVTDSIQVTAAIDIGEVVSAANSVSGAPVRSAAKLRLQARPGEVLVSPATTPRIRHAARLEDRGDASTLIEIAPSAPAFARRLDTPLVGRARELRALRDALRRTKQRGSAGAALLLGSAGVGKSRLALELTRRSRGVHTLVGRCLSYGDGITYWPVREMLEQAPESPERAALLDAFGADAPPPTDELALRFRRLCEAIARTKPLIVVFDDLHWAEPTLLDLIEHLVRNGRGPILVVCPTRDELFDDRPAFLEEEAEHVALEGLSVEETDELLDHLDGAILDPGQRARLVRAAEGNPFFLEQLVALAFEGGVVEHTLPETIRALLSTRLDRLGPGERAVLERGSIVGKEFTVDDVVALIDPAGVPSLEAHLGTLADRGFLQPRGDGGYTFRHALLQEVAYRGAPKRLRAELHELFADRLETDYGSLAELDEFVGYHLERAHKLRLELGETGRRVDDLAEDAGRRLGAGGFRALKRGDIPAAVSLLERATALLPPGDSHRLGLLNELGVAQQSAGDLRAASRTFSDTIAESASSNEQGPELRARIERAYIDLLTEPEGAADELLAVADTALPTLEALGDARNLARAWLLVGYVRGGILGNHAAWEEAEERALVYYKRTPFPPATCIGQIAAALYWGPTPVEKGISRCSTLLEDLSIGAAGRAALLPYLGGLEAQLERLDEARERIAEATSIFEELGARGSVMIHCGTVLADVELLAAEYEAAEQTLREQCEFFELAGDRSHLAVRAAKLADALLHQERLEEAEHWARISATNAADRDQSAQLVVRSVEARLLARRGRLAEARSLAEATVRLADATDGLDQRAYVRLALAEVLRTGALTDDAGRVIGEAIALFDRKGNLAGAARARELAARAEE